MSSRQGRSFAIQRGVSIALGLVTSACFTKPDRVAGTDATVGSGSDAAPASLQARLIRNAYWSNGSGTIGMSATNFSIDSAGIEPGDLVLWIGSIDNGTDTIWGSAGGFTQLKQHTYGNDGQTMVIRYKVAGVEPASYAGTYIPGISSYASVISLIAIRNADSQFPPDQFSASFQTGGNPGPFPAVGTSSGVTTTTPDNLVIYAGGADWEGADDSNTVGTPPGFTPLTSIGDKGGDDWQWTSQQIAYKEHVPVGDTGPVTGTLTSPRMVTGLSWAALIAIAPAPH